MGRIEWGVPSPLRGTGEAQAPGEDVEGNVRMFNGWRVPGLASSFRHKSAVVS